MYGNEQLDYRLFSSLCAMLERRARYCEALIEISSCSSIPANGHLSWVEAFIKSAKMVTRWATFCFRCLSTFYLRPAIGSRPASAIVLSVTLSEHLHLPKAGCNVKVGVVILLLKERCSA